MESLKLETELIEKIQNIDIRILGLLQEDYRLGFNNIAEKVGVSAGTAFNHVKRTVTHIALDFIKEARRVKLQYFKQRRSNILLVKERRR